MGNYVPVAYTDGAAVKRILRATGSQPKIKIGDNPTDHFTSADLTAYILDGSRIIDSYLMSVVTKSAIPLALTYAEVSYAAPRFVAWLMYRDQYQAYRIEQLPNGPRGWIKDGNEFLDRFVNSINEGNYSELSPAYGGPQWESASEFFQKNIGVIPIHDQVENTSDSVPSSGDNLTAGRSENL